VDIVWHNIVILLYVSMDCTSGYSDYFQLFSHIFECGSFAELIPHKRSVMGWA